MWRSNNDSRTRGTHRERMRKTKMKLNKQKLTKHPKTAMQNRRKEKIPRSTMLSGK